MDSARFMMYLIFTLGYAVESTLDLDYSSTTDVNKLTKQEVFLIKKAFGTIIEQSRMNRTKYTCEEYPTKCRSILCKEIAQKYVCEKRQGNQATKEILQAVGQQYIYLIDVILGRTTHAGDYTYQSMAFHMDMKLKRKNEGEVVFVPPQEDSSEYNEGISEDGVDSMSGNTSAEDVRGLLDGERVQENIDICKIQHFGAKSSTALSKYQHLNCPDKKETD